MRCQGYGNGMLLCKVLLGRTEHIRSPQQGQKIAQGKHSLVRQHPCGR